MTTKQNLLSTRMINTSQTRMLLLIGGLGVYYFAIIQYKEYMREIVVAFMLVIIASRVISFIRTRKKLVDAELPDDYIKAYMNSSMLYTVRYSFCFFLFNDEEFIVEKYISKAFLKARESKNCIWYSSLFKNRSGFLIGVYQELHFKKHIARRNMEFLFSLIQVKLLHAAL